MVTASHIYCNHIQKVIIFFQWFGLIPNCIESKSRTIKLEFLSRFLILIFVPFQFGVTTFYTIILLNNKKDIDYASLALIYGTIRCLIIY